MTKSYSEQEKQERAEQAHRPMKRRNSDMYQGLSPVPPQPRDTGGVRGLRRQEKEAGQVWEIP